MRIKNKSKNPKWTILVLVVLILIICAITYFVFIKDKDVSNRNSDDTTQNKDDKENENSGETPVQNEPTDNPPENTGGSIDGYFTHKSISNDVLVLRIQIGELLPSGSCSLTMTNGNKAVSRQAPIINSASTSSCEGFDIPMSELQSGSWKIEIHITANDRSGTITDEMQI